MNSALKPVLAQQPGGQGSPAKANVASVNHAVGHPQGAANSLNHGGNSLVVQNLTHHTVSAAPHPAHAVPSMAPVSANMAQMAQNMSHHGNLSHVTQNSVTPANTAASPSKSASTSAPLSLVQDKANTSQPLALTRTPEKKEPDSSGPANGTIEPSKSSTNAPAALKPQNPEPNKDKQDIAKTSPSTPKPPEKPASVPNTPQKSETPNPVNQSVADGPAQPKVAMGNEPPEKSPTKPTELITASTADIAPTQSDSKPESANNNQVKAATSQKTETVEIVKTNENVKTESPQVEEKKEEPKIDKPVPQMPVEEKKEENKTDIKTDNKKEEQPEKTEKVEEKLEEKKPEIKAPIKSDTKVIPRSTMKLATVTPPIRKRRQVSPNKTSEGATSAKKLAEGESTPEAGARIKRNRTKVQLYQSPTPELTMATKLSASAGRSTPNKQNDDKLIVFYRNEYLAVRNAEGGFYVCQAMQNVYRTTRKIKIRWLSQDKSDPSGETYKPDFYDVTDMECVLTTLSLTRAGGGGAQALSAAEQARARSILERALKAEQSGAGANNIELTEEHPDGCESSHLDLSLYTDESQLEKKSRKRNSSKSSPRAKQESAIEIAKEAVTPAKRARPTPKRSPKSARKPIKQTPPPNKQTNNNNKRKSSGSAPSGANTSKVGIVQRIYRNTATAVMEKAANKSKSTPVKNTPAKHIPAKRTPTKPAKTAKQEKQVTPSTPARKGRRAAKESKPSPIVPTPSTSTGKTTRTPRKPPAKK